MQLTLPAPKSDFIGLEDKIHLASGENHHFLLVTEMHLKHSQKTSPAAWKGMKNTGPW